MSSTKPRRVLGYARVSSAEQALGTSLQDQQNAIHAHAQKRGLNVDRMYVEAESAIYEKAERREQVQALMTEVRADDLVLVDKIDRWSRDPEFAYGSIRTILEKDAHFFAIGDDCDPSTPQGDSMLGLRIFFAREEHKRIRLRMVGTRKLLRDRGLYAEGLPPWGYKRTGGKGPERNVLLVDEVEAPRVRDMFRLSIEGYSLSEIARKIGVHRDRIRTVLRSRHYLGEIKDSSGEWIQARHPPIVDLKTFARSMMAIEERRKGDRRARADSHTQTWWLRDLARCALCGAKMSAAYGGHGRDYYFCYKRCTNRFVRVDRVEHEAIGLFVERLAELREDLAKSSKPIATVDASASLERKRVQVQVRRERFIEMYADGAISRERLREEMSKLDAERTRIDALATVDPPVSREQKRQALRNVASVRTAWDGATPQERRALAQSFARCVRIAPGQTPIFEWYSAEELARRA